jgi:hypothetical protein
VISSSGDSWVSPGVMSLTGGEFAFKKGATVRDPDGHVMLLEQP